MCLCRNTFLNLDLLHRISTKGVSGHIYCQDYNHIGLSARASAEKQRKLLAQQKLLSRFPSDTLRVVVQDNTTQTSHGPTCRPINSVKPDRRTARENAKASHLLQGIKRRQQVTFQPWTIKRGDVEKKKGGGEGGGGQRSRRLPENNGVGGK